MTYLNHPSKYPQACYAGAPSYSPVPIRPCLDYVAGGTAASRKWSDIANGILFAANDKWAMANETNWDKPREEYLAAMTAIEIEAEQHTKDEYWVAINEMAEVFEADPYQVYDLFEDMPNLPRPFNCIRGICQSVYNTRSTTLEQLEITLAEYIHFYDKFYSP